MFAIKIFFPSIQEELLDKRLRFAREYIDVTSKDAGIVYHACIWYAKALFNINYKN